MKSECFYRYALILAFVSLIASPLVAQQWEGGEDSRTPIYREGEVAIGTTQEPIEKLEVGGGIRLGNTLGLSLGTLRWTGTDFEGRTSTGWKSLIGSWGISGDNIYNTNSGNVGIGNIINPLEKLDVAGAMRLGTTTSNNAGTIQWTGNDFQGYNGSEWESLVSKWYGDGNPGGTIGTLASHVIIGSGNLCLGSPVPLAKLSIQMQNQDWDQGIALHSVMYEGHDSYCYIIQKPLEGLVMKSEEGYMLYGSTNPLFILSESGNYISGTTQIDGSVGIGSDSWNPSYELNVDGEIRANEIVVNTGGADFVFNDDYELKNLTEVENFIKENKHLPEIPTAEDVQENGVSIGEMQTKLLQKIEELTLYIIEQEKRIKELEEKN